MRVKGGKSSGSTVRQRSQATPLTVRPLTAVTKRTLRGIARDLVSTHTTEIATRLRDGLLSDNLKIALKYLTFVGDRTEGRPVETHRMVDLNEGPTGAYDLSKLSPVEQKKLLQLLRNAKDTTTPSAGEERKP